jgi:heme-degrading monooxygenase HmoA
MVYSFALDGRRSIFSMQHWRCASEAARTPWQRETAFKQIHIDGRETPECGLLVDCSVRYRMN